MKKYYSKIFLVISILIFCWAVFSLLVSYKLTHRTGVEYSEQAIPENKKDVYERISFLTDDSLIIYGVTAFKKNAPVVVLLLHGNGDDYSVNYELMDSLYHRGINSMAISHRCHGSSGGSLNDIGYSARYDVIGAIEYIKSIVPNSQIVIAGRSLGASAAIFAYESVQDDVKALLLESPYYDLMKAVKYRLKYYMPDYAADLGYYNLYLFSTLFIKDIDDISPFKYSKNLLSADNVIFIGGSKDVRAPLKDIQLISENVPKSIVTNFEGAGHEALFLYDKKKYLSLLLNLCGSEY